MTINDALRKLLSTLGVVPSAKSRSTSSLINDIAENYTPGGGGSDLPDPSAENDGRVLMTASGEWGIGDIPRGGLTKIHLTYDDVSERYVADKTEEELHAAVLAGDTIVAYWNNPLTGPQEPFLVKTSVQDIGGESVAFIYGGVSFAFALGQSGPIMRVYYWGYGDGTWGYYEGYCELTYVP